MGTICTNILISGLLGEHTVAEYTTVHSIRYEVPYVFIGKIHGMHTHLLGHSWVFMTRLFLVA